MVFRSFVVRRSVSESQRADARGSMVKATKPADDGLVRSVDRLPVDRQKLFVLVDKVWILLRWSSSVEPTRAAEWFAPTSATTGRRAQTNHL
uniref:Uncharacterized protein n=1 Tax=Plectus sambesii TaxID=2011161 RepID=A0A914VKP9_9BILA